jgi:hypothetical protein
MSGAIHNYSGAYSHIKSNDPDWAIHEENYLNTEP